MKKMIGIVVIVTALCGVAGEYVTRAMGTSGVAVTNDQKTPCRFPPRRSVSPE
jgi:hypothetical protein